MVRARVAQSERLLCALSSKDALKMVEDRKNVRGRGDSTLSKCIHGLKLSLQVVVTAICLQEETDHRVPQEAEAGWTVK